MDAAIERVVTTLPRRGDAARPAVVLEGLGATAASLCVDANSEARKAAANENHVWIAQDTPPVSDRYAVA